MLVVYVCGVSVELHLFIIVVVVVTSFRFFCSQFFFPDISFCFTFVFFFLFPFFFFQLSHFYWGVWALIQSFISDIDFDFLQYAIERFEQYYKVRDEYLALQ